MYTSTLFAGGFFSLLFILFIIANVCFSYTYIFFAFHFFYFCFVLSKKFMQYHPTAGTSFALFVRVYLFR